MRRRDFIVALGGAVVGPISTRAQQAPIPLVGFLHSGIPELNAGDVAEFRRGLRERGFVEGINLQIEFRWARDRYEQLPALARELVRIPANVIFTLGGVAPARAAKAATSVVPIVFAHGADPVSTGLVASINRPGGNMTGLTFFNGVLSAKRLELLRKLVPTATNIALLVNPKSASGEPRITEILEAARALGINTTPINASTAAEIDLALVSIKKYRADALYVIGDPLYRTHRAKIVDLENQSHIPTIHSSRDTVAIGGLMSYGARVTDATYQAGIYVARILDGEKPADLPILQPTKFELSINLKTAKALGLTVPPTLLARADEVIE